MSRSDISTTPAAAADIGGEPVCASPAALRAPEPASAGAPAADAVWVLESYRAGENTQLLGLAERLGRPFRRIVVTYRRHAGVLGLLRVTTRAGVGGASAELFAPPWPALVISAGLRNEPLCAWIRRASGGRTRVVFIGRTWRARDCVDLLVTTPQYRLRPAPRVLVNLLTQHRVTAERLRDAAERQASRFAGRPRPLIAVLLGGNSGPYVLGPRSAARMGAQLSTLVAATGGSLAISSSSRTPPAFLDVLLATCGPVTLAYRWRPDDPDNPYYAMLALADAVVVTGDSVAMLSEAAATGKPVFIFDIPTDAKADATLAARWYRGMMRWLPDRLTRDVALFQRRFVAAGLGRFLDDRAGDVLADALSDAAAGPPPVGQEPGAPDPVLERVEALLYPAGFASAGASPIRPRSTR